MRLAKAFLLADALPFEERYRAYMQVFDAGERAALLRGGGPAVFDDCIARGFAGAQTTDPLRQLMDVDFCDPVARGPTDAHRQDEHGCVA